MDPMDSMVCVDSAQGARYGEVWLRSVRLSTVVVPRPLEDNHDITERHFRNLSRLLDHIAACMTPDDGLYKATAAGLTRLLPGVSADYRQAVEEHGEHNLLYLHCDATPPAAVAPREVVTAVTPLLQRPGDWLAFTDVGYTHVDFRCRPGPAESVPTRVLKACLADGFFLHV